MKLSERWDHVSHLKAKLEKHPGVQYVKVGWESYGKDIEIEAIQAMQQRDGNIFKIEELNTPRKGAHSKDDRIERLEPDFRLGRFLLPMVVHHPDRGGRCSWRVWTEEANKRAEASGEKNYPVGTISISSFATISRRGKPTAPLEAMSPHRRANQTPRREQGCLRSDARLHGRVLAAPVRHP